MRDGFRIRVRPWTPRASPRDYQIDYSPPWKDGDSSRHRLGFLFHS